MYHTSIQFRSSIFILLDALHYVYVRLLLCSKYYFTIRHVWCNWLISLTGSECFPIIYINWKTEYRRNFEKMLWFDSWLYICDTFCKKIVRVFLFKKWFLKIIPNNAVKTNFKEKQILMSRTMNVAPIQNLNQINLAVDTRVFQRKVLEN